MKPRERNIAIGAGAVVGALLIYVCINELVISPAATIDADCRRLEANIVSMKVEVAKGEGLRSRLRSLAARTYDRSEMRVDEQVGEELVHLARRSGLDTRNLDIKKANISRKRDVYKEVKRNLTVQGKLESIVNLLFLLGRDAHLHKVTNVSIRPRLHSGEVQLELAYMTLVLEGKPDEFAEARPGPAAAATSKPAALATSQPAGLGGEDRARYNLIVARDLFRPYIQGHAAPPPREVVVAKSTEPVKPPVKPVVREPKLFVVDLSSYFGDSDVSLQDAATREIHRYKVGERLGNATIAMVDYRPLPRPQNPLVMSYSRMILLADGEYWAVELGQSLDDRRRLTNDELPRELRTVRVPSPTPVTLPATEPATNPASAPATSPATNPAGGPATAPATGPATAPAATESAPSSAPATAPASSPASAPAAPATCPASVPATAPATSPATAPAAPASAPSANA